ncbi:MAG: hypothetical protein H7334_01745 [Ferruginibacter sp.]|nr:hypothetical protein [Ferruginibacter sp.]
MKKIIMFTLVALCASGAVMAQRSQNFKFSVGTELLFPTGSFATGYSFGIGATAQAEIPVQQNLNVTGTTGIIFYNGKSLGGVKNTGLNIIPIKAGVKYFFTDGIYGAAQLGIGILNKGGGTAFAYTPAIGYEFRTRRGRALDVSFKYDGYSVKDYITRIGNVGGTLSEFGFRTALRF